MHQTAPQMHTLLTQTRLICYAHNSFNYMESPAHATPDIR